MSICGNHDKKRRVFPLRITPPTKEKHRKYSTRGIREVRNERKSYFCLKQFSGKMKNCNENCFLGKLLIKEVSARTKKTEERWLDGVERQQ